MLDDIRLTLYQLAVKFLHIKFCLTHTSRIEIRKKYSVIPLLIKYGCAATLCPSMNFSIPHFAHIQQRHALIWACLLLCFDLSIRKE